MASVVIIHAQEDALPARALAEKLRIVGLTPLTELAGSDGFRDAARSAAAIVALWSPRSVEHPELVAAAQFARDQGPILHARMQNAPNPGPFADENSIDLTGWRGQDDFPAWQDLLKAVLRRAGLPETAAAPPPRAAASASPFFQPGAAAPQPAGPAAAAAAGVVPMPARPTPRRAPAQLAAEALEERLAPIRPLSEVSATDYARRAETREPIEPKPAGGGKLALIGGATFLAVAVLGLGGYFAFDRFQASQSADAAWTQVDTDEASDLQAFLEHHAGSSHDREARERLAELDQEGFTHARAADTVEAFQRYLGDFPEGEHALQARGRIAELRAMPTPAVPLNPAIDPATGLPIGPNTPPTTQNPDLVPPGMGDLGGPPVESTEGGGPVPLAPPPTNAPAGAPDGAAPGEPPL